MNRKKILMLAALAVLCCHTAAVAQKGNSHSMVKYYCVDGDNFKYCKTYYKEFDSKKRLALDVAYSEKKEGNDTTDYTRWQHGLQKDGYGMRVRYNRKQYLTGVEMTTDTILYRPDSSRYYEAVYKYNAQSSKWEPTYTYKSRDVTDGKGRLLASYSERNRPRSSEGVVREKDTFVYNSKGLLVGWEHYELRKGEWQRVDTERYTYGKDGRWSSIETGWYDTYDQRNYYIDSLEWLDWDKRTKKKYYMTEETEKGREPFLRYHRQELANGGYSATEKVWNRLGKDWNTTVRSWEYRDEHGHVTEHGNWEVEEGGGTEEYVEYYQHTYDAKGRLTESIASSKDPDLGVIVEGKYVYEY